MTNMPLATDWPFPILHYVPTDTATTGRRHPTTGKSIPQGHADPVTIEGSFQPNPVEDETTQFGGELRPGDGVIFTEAPLIVGSILDVALTPAPHVYRTYRVKGIVHPQAVIYKHTGRQRICWHLKRKEEGPPS